MCMEIGLDMEFSFSLSFEFFCGAGFQARRAYIA